MALPSSGPLTLTDIQTEFGGANPIGLNEYYAGGTYVPAGTSGTGGAVPSSGAISIANFYGTSAALAAYAWLIGGQENATTSTNMQVLNMTTLGDVTSYGTLSFTLTGSAGGGSSTRGVTYCGNVNGTATGNIYYYALATTGSTALFGQLATGTGASYSSMGSSTRGVFQTPNTTTMWYITFATLGNAATFGTTTSLFGTICTSSTTRGLSLGGANGYTPFLNINYITIATLGNSTNFGTIAASALYGSGPSNGTRGVYGAYANAVAIGAQTGMNYVTIATLGNSTTFGTLAQARAAGTYGNAESTTRGVFYAGQVQSGTVTNNVYITIATTGNGTTFGSVVANTTIKSTCSNTGGGR